MRQQHIIDELYSKFFNPSLYYGALGLLVVLMLISATLLAQKTYDRQQQYRQLLVLEEQRMVLLTEQQRLILEERTYAATPNVARRAILQMGMHYPDSKERLLVGVQ